LFPGRERVFDRRFAAFNQLSVFVSVVVRVQHHHRVAFFLRALDVRQLGAGVQVVVDDEASGKRMIKHIYENYLSDNLTKGSVRF
jgi:hypothetical protein